MVIRQAAAAEYDAVRAFYYDVIDGMDGREYRPGWQKDVYPAPDQLRQLINAGELYIGLEEGKIISAMALNHSFNEGYNQAPWAVRAERDEVFVIHMLAVLPALGGRGLGSEMVHFAVKHAERQHVKAIRLDVLKGNLPANRLYEAAGFQKLYTLTMYYPDTGYTDFELYELTL